MASYKYGDTSSVKKYQEGHELIVLGGHQGHDMLVVGAIAHMGVDEDIRVPVLKDGCERPGIPGILLDEVAVEVVVAGISRKPYSCGPFWLAGNDCFGSGPRRYYTPE